MPDLPGISTQCGDCGAHFQLDARGDVAGTACSECGGKRFFRTQPSPTQSDGTLRDMVDMQAGGVDRGGSPNTEGSIMASAIGEPCVICGAANGECPHTTFAPHSDLMGIDTRPLPQETPGDPHHEGVIMGEDGEKPRGFNDSYMHSKVANPSFQEITRLRQGLTPELQHQVDDLYTHQGERAALDFLRKLSPSAPQQGNQGNPCWDTFAINGEQTVAKRVETMRTSNMEPYATLWDESYLPPKTAGPLAEAAPAFAAGLGRMLPFALPSLMRGALGQGQGQQAGGMAPEQPTPAPSMEVLTSADIPFVLLADYDTPQSVKSIGEQHDDPQNQDQKEFNDGDQSPKNLKNPNLEDSGADGEDGVRDATDGYGIGANSPSVERAQMILPLLLHYFQSDESGQSDPLIRALHDSLEKESPDYLKNEHPDGQKYVELIIQNHNKPEGTVANWTAPTGGLGTWGTMFPESPGGGSPGGGGTCPVCGGVLAGDGSCPQCGSKQHPQGGMSTGLGEAPLTPGLGGGPSYPPNRVGTSGAGPQTPEQKAAVVQLLQRQGREGEAPMVELEPWRFAQELAEIQGQPNVAPLVDPSQAQPTPAPMQPMMQAPGSMPVPDPSQMGGGMGQPMQPMAHTAETYGPSTGWPRELPAPRNQEAFHYTQPGEGAMGGDELGLGRCPQCGQQSLTPYNGICQDGNCGFTMPKDSQDVALPQHDPQGAHTLSPGDMDLGSQHPHWGKQADANNAAPRCPTCQTATTSILDGNEGEGQHKYRCHSCQGVFPLSEKKGRVILTDLMNPSLQNAAEKHEERPEGTQDSTLTWQDTNGQPLVEGAVYELNTPGYATPDYVKVVGPPKPDQVSLKLVGAPAGIPGTEDDQTPDFSITPQDMDLYKYTFKPSDEQNPDESQATPLGGMPGLEQIPQQAPTTDELSSSYPNPGTMASVVASTEIEEPYDDLCHKCGCDWITHTASSETSTMHECARCGTAWETRDEYEGRRSSADLDWLRESAQSDDFFSEMERAKSMSEYAQQSRNLGTVAAKDDRLQAVRDVLSRNRSEREQRTAGRHFTPSEQRALVNERGTARNLEDLDLTNTHYETRYDATGKANGMNAPDAHLILGL